MPAYNAAGTLESAVECLLSQTFGDFVLVISDNASADDTLTIARRFERQDSRVRVVAHPQNIGANLNYAGLVRHASGEYFKWASSNDWCAPTFLQRCVEVLDSRADVVIAVPRCRSFASNPSEYTTYPHDIDALQDDPVARFRHVYYHLALNNVFNGVIRMSALKRTRGVEHYPSSDVILMVHMALLGKLFLLDEALFYRRLEAKSATHLMTPEQVHRHHYPTTTSRALLPSWRRALALLDAVVTSPLGANAKARALLAVARMCYYEKSFLLGDLGAAARYVVSTR